MSSPDAVPLTRLIKIESEVANRSKDIGPVIVSVDVAFAVVRAADQLHCVAAKKENLDLDK